MATLVFVHAHPDDEAILTAGTMRALVEAGHSVVLVLATDGGAGLTSSAHQHDLGLRRLDEAANSAHALGITERIWLGYADSGLDGAQQSDNETFCKANPEDAALRLAEVLQSHSADAVIGYDVRGGYGHPDHIRLHHVVHRAAEIAGTANVFEATLDRGLIRRLIFPLIPLGLLANIAAINNVTQGFSESAAITHAVDVRTLLAYKRNSMQAHASQTVGGGVPRSLQVFLMLPDAVLSRVLGTEFFVQTRGKFDHNPIAELPQTSVIHRRGH